jgi:hypothetical protein
MSQGISAKKLDDMYSWNDLRSAGEGELQRLQVIALGQIAIALKRIADALDRRQP